MQQIEHAVGHHHDIAARARCGDPQQQLLLGDQAFLARCRTVQRELEFRAARRSGTQLGDDDSGRDVRQPHGVRHVLARRDSGGERRDHRIAGAGDVEHLARLGGQVQGRFSRPQQAHALLAARDQQRIQMQIVDQARALADQRGVVRAGPDDGLEFAQVGRQHRGAAIAREVVALGIDDDRLLQGLALRDQRRHVHQRALRVIREHGDLHLAQADGEPLDQPGAIERAFARVRLLEVEPDDLLVARQHAQLGDRRQPRRLDPVGFDAMTAQLRRERGRRRIASDDTEQRGLRAQRGEIQGDVGRTTGPRIVATDADHRNRRFRRDALRRTRPVAVEHHVARDEQAGLREIRDSVHGQSLAPCPTRSPDEVRGRRSGNG